jgi:Na+-translocating ferredoxin:NAD+ oxidoreductase subunit E
VAVVEKELPGASAGTAGRAPISVQMIGDIKRGIIDENPALRLVLGMCPALAVTTSFINGLGLGLATMAVLICSNIVISLIGPYIPSKVRIPSYIVIIASFVTVVDMMMAAYTPDLHRVLGIFVPLITVNCIILGRAEAFASKNSVLRALADGVGMGLGFTFVMATMGIIRGLLGMGMLIDWQLLPDSIPPLLFFILPPGAFLVLGYLIGLANHISASAGARRGRPQ